MTSETDEAGYFINRKHVVVSFELSGVTDLSLTGFSTQNVILGLSIEKMPKDCTTHDGAVLRPFR